jgi:thiol:disulfide interchange protein DsbG
MITSLRLHLPSLAASAASLALVGAALAASAPDAAAPRPPALKALEAHGLTVVGTFPAPGGLTAWAAYAGQQPVALYATPDGKHVIAGTMLDADGKDVTRTALEQAVRAPMAAGVWKQLEASRWIADGKPDAPRTVYMFTDPNCPYCNKFWSDARPWVDSGKVQIRHVLVGILTPTSQGKAAALLADRNPSAALASYEGSQAAANAKAIAAGHAKPLADGPLKPLDKVPAAVATQLEGNEKLMASLRFEATPAFVWRDAAGKMQTRVGAPESALAAILGPR